MGEPGTQAVRQVANRWILHVDLDQFLASVELRRHPELVGLPVIVGGNGDPAEPRKVVTCASYEAREFGVHAGMPLRTAARRCPDATFLPSDPDAYDEASEQVMGLLRDLGHPLEVWGWDEAYLGADVADPLELAERIRTVVAAETGLSCSVGISDNKQRAKVATGFGKPSRTRGADEAQGVFALTDENWMPLMGDRGVDALWGVGPKTAKRLAGLGITTVADLAVTDPTLLTATFGPTTGLWILLLAKGGGDAEVSAEPWVPRSRSHVITFPEDLTERTEMDSAISELARKTLAEVLEQNRIVTRVAVRTVGSVPARSATVVMPSPARRLAVLGPTPQSASTPRSPITGIQFSSVSANTPAGFPNPVATLARCLLSLMPTEHDRSVSAATIARMRSANSTGSATSAPR
ncbi:MAG: polymerase [Mycobacterium sp.]|nr:polymerase [Mycobacterium sp.]